ncbi:MAG: hypothetical protein P0Y49_15370 [Candidatus Pedobacter colombiensis]|uniref:Uncharacterized protein n=1 Tax=Candidatus Pedobacter colombiensis TaxID=3121371 RepID=A0AAJ5W5X8_9SPHI|nr:hypothetical protein [Pedobacter sp.]WEK18170.1 MAG: hypothetical protein P0Y49_15370 [Pedobacter sp.]
MKDLIKEITKGAFLSAVVGIVKSVDLDNFTCDVETLTEGEVLDVRLRASVDQQKNGSTLIPKIGSSVILAPIDNNRTQYYVAMFSEVDELSIQIQGQVFQMAKGGMSLKNDKEDLKGILTSFCEEMLKIYAPKNVPGINNLKIRIKNLLK